MSGMHVTHMLIHSGYMYIYIYIYVYNIIMDAHEDTCIAHIYIYRYIDTFISHEYAAYLVPRLIQRV